MSEELYTIPFYSRAEDKELFKCVFDVAKDKIVAAIKKHKEGILKQLNKNQKTLAKKNNIDKPADLTPENLQFFMRLGLEEPNLEKIINEAIIKKLKPNLAEGFASIDQETRTQAFLKSLEPVAMEISTANEKKKMLGYIQETETMFQVSLQDKFEALLEEANKKKTEEKEKEEQKRLKQELKDYKKDNEEKEKLLKENEEEKKKLLARIESLEKQQNIEPKPEPVSQEQEKAETEKTEAVIIEEEKKEAEFGLENQEDITAVNGDDFQDALNGAILIGKLDVSSLSSFLQNEKITINVSPNFQKEAWGGLLPYTIYKEFYLRDNQLSFSQKITPDFVSDFLQIDNYYDLTDDAKRQAIINGLSDNVLLFTPSVKKSKTEDGKRFSACRIVDLKPVLDARFNNAILIPSIEYHRPGLEKAIKEGEPINFECYDRRLHLSLRYVICDNALYRVNLKPVPGHNTLWVSQDNTLQLLSKDFLSDITQENRFDFEIEMPGGDFLIYHYVPSRAIISLESVGEITSTKAKTTKAVPSVTEKDFIESFISKTFENHLAYDKDDLVNFHVALKTSQLVILAGASGTGKTQLPLLYAKTFNMNEELGTVLFVPITPSYTEPNDILGYFRPSQTDSDYDGTYIESQTGLVKFLLDAEKNPDRLYMVVFDEMNLSQIEYWFSPFMSLLERKVGERRLTLYSKDLRCSNGMSIPSSITIGDNIEFIGTINLDETTKDISDRLADRAIILNLRKMKIADYVSRMKEQQSRTKTPSLPYSGVSFSSFQKKVDDFSTIFTEKEIAFFDELNDLINTANSKKLISYRTLKQIAGYLKNAEDLQDYLSRSLALDEMVKETILTKLNGSDEGLLELLTSKEDDKRITGVFDRYKDLSDFSKSREVIEKKQNELEIYGYTR